MQSDGVPNQLQAVLVPLIILPLSGEKLSSGVGSVNLKSLV